MSHIVTPMALRAALGFLRQLDPQDAADLPATIDYTALQALARSRGFDTDADALAEAFRVLMQMRLVGRRQG